MERKQWNAIAGQIATPAYVFDLDGLRARTERIRSALAGRAGICYAASGPGPGGSGWSFPVCTRKRRI